MAYKRKSSYSRSRSRSRSWYGNARKRSTYRKRPARRRRSSPVNTVKLVIEQAPATAGRIDAIGKMAKPLAKKSMF